MRALKLVGSDDPVLRAVCEDVHPPSLELYTLSQGMVTAMQAHGGIGLAAPQVGYPFRMFCMVHGRGVLTLCNPVWKPVLSITGRNMSEAEEGCLSLPGVSVKVARYETITVQWTGLDGRLLTQKFRGIEARCIQHEIDHLNGVLIT